ncbi:MAG: PAS domain-containing protein [Synergistaceae bacterium]
MLHFNTPAEELTRDFLLKFFSKKIETLLPFLCCDVHFYYNKKGEITGRDNLTQFIQETFQREYSQIKIKSIKIKNIAKSVEDVFAIVDFYDKNLLQEISFAVTLILTKETDTYQIKDIHMSEINNKNGTQFALLTQFTEENDTATLTPRESVNEETNEHENRYLPKYRNLLNRIPCGLVILCSDAQNNITPMYFSDKFYDIFPNSKKDFKEMSDFNRIIGVHSSDLEKVNSLKEYILNSDKDEDFVSGSYRFCGETDIYKWLSISIYMEKIANGDKLIYLAYLDVDEQVNMREEIMFIYDNIPAALYSCKIDENWSLIRANNKFYEMLGYTRDDFEQMNNEYTKVIHKDDQERISISIQECLQTNKKVVDLEYRVICKNNEIKWIYEVSSIIKTTTGPAYTYNVFVDITDKKEIEKKLADQRERNIVILNHSNLVYWEHNLREKTATFADKAMSCFGVPHELENYPTSLFESGHIHEDDIQSYKDAIGRIEKGSRKEIFEIRVKKTDEHEWGWMKILCSSLVDENGEVYEAIYTAEDMTDVKELENHFFYILEQNNIVSWIYDIKEKTLTMLANDKYTELKKGETLASVPESLITREIFDPSCIDTI